MLFRSLLRSLVEIYSATAWGIPPTSIYNRNKRRCPNTYREFVGYEFAQDKDGNFISQYPKANDHTIDSVRYALRQDMDGATYSFD